MDRSLLKTFWNCGDNEIIDFAIHRARLNRIEREVIRLTLDECTTQEAAAEIMEISPRRFQEYWYSASDKLLNIPWVAAYARELCYNKSN